MKAESTGEVEGKERLGTQGKDSFVGNKVKVNKYEVNITHFLSCLYKE